MDDHKYNLMMQAIQESKSLKRIQEHYQQDTDDCEECREFWEKLEQDKKEHIADLKELIREHL